MSDIRKYLHLKFIAIKEISSFNNYSIKFLCEILKVNRKSYYKYLKRIPSKIEIENITHSISKKGNSLDKGLIESFFWSLKVEKYYKKI